jgi:hypothetical protein
LKSRLNVYSPVYYENAASITILLAKTVKCTEKNGEKLRKNLTFCQYGLRNIDKRLKEREKEVKPEVKAVGKGAK